MSEAVKDDIRGDIVAAYESLQGNEIPAAAESTAAPVGAEGAEGPAAAAAKDPSTDTTGVKRDPTGRFAPKDPEPTAQAPTTGDAQPTSETAKPKDADASSTGASPTGEPMRVPSSLTPAMKAKFHTLEPEVQQAFSKLDEDVRTAKATWDEKASRLNRYDEIFAPRREQLAMRGLDGFQAIQMLFAAQDLLDRNPAHGIAELARSYGVNLGHLAQQTSGGQPGAGAQFAPTQPGFDPNALHPMIAQALAPYQQRLDQLVQQSEAEKQAEAQRLVRDVATNPGNIYWENVKQTVAHLIESGQATDLQAAYETACWANPEIRELLIAAKTQSVEQQREAASREAAQQRQTAERQRSQQAARAAGSVTGAPQGVQGAPAEASTGNLGEDIRAAFRKVNGAV